MKQNKGPRAAKNPDIRNAVVEHNERIHNLEATVEQLTNRLGLALKNIETLAVNTTNTQMEVDTIFYALRNFRKRFFSHEKMQKLADSVLLGSKIDRKFVDPFNRICELGGAYLALADSVAHFVHNFGREDERKPDTKEAA